MTVTPPRSDTSSTASSSAATSPCATAASQPPTLPSSAPRSPNLPPKDPNATASSATNAVPQHQQGMPSMSQLSGFQAADESSLADFDFPRRHSVPVLPMLSLQPPQQQGINAFKYTPQAANAPGYIGGRMMHHRGSMSSLQDAAFENAGARSSLSSPTDFTSGPPLTRPIGAPPRSSMPASSNEMQSAAQWYFGGNQATSNSLANILNNPNGSGGGMPMNGGGGVRGGFAAMPMQQPRFNGFVSQRFSAQQPATTINHFGFESSHAPTSMGTPSGVAAYQPGGSLSCFLVQFTSGRTDTYYVPNDSTLSVSVGDYVVVEADRGEDLGRVFMDNISVPLPRRNSTSVMYGQFEGAVSPTYEMDDFCAQPSLTPAQLSNSPVPSNFPKRIYRLAQPIEIESLLGKVRDEINAIAVGQYKVQEWKLPMAIIDAEYQWDRRKLTFFFSVTLPQFYPNQPPPRIDFRTLVRDLYQIYRTRIWMYCVDKDKNRANRAHNREKFLKQLYKDTMQYHRSPTATPGPNGTVSSGPGNTGGASSVASSAASISSSTASDGLTLSQHGPPQVPMQSSDLQQGGTSVAEWDMREVFKNLHNQNAAVNVDELTFGVNKLKMQQQQHQQQQQHSGDAGVTSGYSTASKTIWSDKPPSVTSKYGSLGGVDDGKESHLAGSGASSGEFANMPYFVDYGAPTS